MGIPQSSCFRELLVWHVFVQKRIDIVCFYIPYDLAERVDTVADFFQCFIFGVLLWGTGLELSFRFFYHEANGLWLMSWLCA